MNGIIFWYRGMTCIDSLVLFQIGNLDKVFFVRGEVTVYLICFRVEIALCLVSGVSEVVFDP